MLRAERNYLWTEPAVAWGAFAVLLATYWLTVAPTVSFWDCPEYVSAAYLLEIGHPPGNPTWMLVERIVTMFFPARYAALAVNLSSGLFTAFAGFFLAKTIFRVAVWVLLKMPRRGIPVPIAAAGASLCGSLIFGWCDSVWFSAVEAEVYAMSLFMTSLCVWLMTKWAGTANRGDSWRLLVLIAYLFGLSIGIHQLNLLCIPALAMIWAVRRGIRTTGRLLFIFLISCVAVGCVLVGMMPSTIAIASKFELLAVNVLNLPALWGVGIYVALLALSLLLALWSVALNRSRALMAACCFPAIILSGIFVLGEHYAAGALISALVSVLLVTGSNFTARRLYLSIWMLAMLLTGYSSYALIPVRGHIPSPANAAMPGNPFSFAAYQSREQYGSKPLLYGPTPYSKPLLREETDENGHASYSKYALSYHGKIYAPKEDSARLRSDAKGLSEKDIAENRRVMGREGDGYVVKGVRTDYVTTPELNMWFPRITGSSSYDLEAYADWVGMDSASMTAVRVTEAVDSSGNFVTRLDSDGRRREAKSLRPTYLQNLQWFLTYQTSYMYWRYLLWNFAGRQNDRPAQGEVQHGNFITGFPALDNAMLGAEDSLPDAAGKGNRGRNRYFALPLLLGILGIIRLLLSRRRGMEACFVIAVLFVMTGLAITVYLNQGPGEPRERDYSFLGSYLAFAIWTGFGALAIARLFRSAWGFIFSLGVAGWMCFQNFDDHDRSGQYVAREFASAILNSAEPDAIIFVNGDNFTFPLWYAQETEGIRRDVRVVNLAYLSSPTYAANLMEAWRESEALPTALKREDIIWDAFRSVSIPASSRDTLPLPEMWAKLKASERAEFPSRFVKVPTAEQGEIIYDLRNLGGGRASFANLMMFDIITSSETSGKRRPVYWIGQLGPSRRIGLDRFTSPWLFGRRFGVDTEGRADSLMLAAARLVKTPNKPGKDVYMDYAPSVHTGIMRSVLINTGKRLLRSGKIREAAEMAEKADIPMGEGADTYTVTTIGDTAFNVRRELGLLLQACADSLAGMAGSASPREKEYLTAKSLEMQARGLHHLKELEKRRREWQHYREALPPRLRNKMAPTY